MKNLSNILLPVGLLCFLGALGIAALNVFVIIAVSFGFERLFFYFQYLNLPALSAALPAAGILALLPLALRLAFARDDSAEKDKVSELEDWRGGAKAGGGGYHVKHA